MGWRIDIGLAGLCLAFLAACGGGGGQSGTPGEGQGGGNTGNTGTAPVVQDQTASLVVWGTGVSQLSQTFQAQGQGLVFAIASQPQRGLASIDPSTGQLTYVLQGNPVGPSDAVGVRVSNAKGTVTAQLLINMNYDPLLTFQWHLKSTGQTVFSSTKPTSGMDIKVHGAWQAGYTGEGVVVNVVDTGLEIAHEDLQGNVLENGSRNLLTGTNDPTPETNAAIGDHGTAVAGVIAAQGFNNKGIRGVAYKAKLMGHNYLKAQSLSNFSKSFGGTSTDAAAAADIFNASFGWATCNWMSPSQAYDAVIANTTTLRAGKGAVVLKTAGNGFLSCDGITDQACLNFGVSCFNANSDQFINTMHNAVVVGSLNSNGVKASTASTGSNLWISAFGGQNGADVDVYSAADVNDRKPGILTTDRSGCVNGYHSTKAYNDFEVNSPIRTRWNSDCNYTSTFTGTSAATPMVSGVVALMLQARPELTYRDVKHLLAATAAPVDAAKAANTNSAVFNKAFVLELPWVTNAAGYRFHNWYGFGLLNASAAVSAATAHNLLPPEQSFEMVASADGAQIPGGSSTPWRADFVASGQAKVEVVELAMTVDRNSFKPNCAQIELQSPSGTRSILLNMKSAHTTAPAGRLMRFLSNAFYGESMAGAWTLNVYNGCAATMGLAADTSQLIRIKGH
jgi:subtilisin family serine protease